MAASAAIRELETRIRDVINRPRLHHSLVQSRADFHMLCSALDTIGDTELAIAAHSQLSTDGNKGLGYLALYGVLQALFIQQDAATHLLDALLVEHQQANDDLKFVREIRNCATGHPTKREAKPKKRIPRSSHAISRPSLKSDRFTLFNWDEHSGLHTQEVDLQLVLACQRRAITAMLEAALSTLTAREKEHRMKFRDKKLAGLFHPQVGYYIEKVFEGCHGNRDRGAFAAIHVKLLSDLLMEFRTALTQRGILPAYSHVEEEIADVEYALNELRAYFSGDYAGTLNSRTSGIFTFFVKHKLEYLKKVAMDFDNEYAEDVL